MIWNLTYRHICTQREGTHSQVNVPMACSCEKTICRHTVLTGDMGYKSACSWVHCSSIQTLIKTTQTEKQHDHVHGWLAGSQSSPSVASFILTTLQSGLFFLTYSRVLPLKRTFTQWEHQYIQCTLAFMAKHRLTHTQRNTSTSTHLSQTVSYGLIRGQSIATCALKGPADRL